MVKTNEEILVDDFGFENVEFTGDDCHAYYYDALGCEIKITKDDEWVWYKNEGSEDWEPCDGLKG